MTNNARSFHSETMDHVQTVPVCGCCGRHIPAYPSPDAQDYLEITKKWGYFSGKDGETHHFYVCESCYDAWIASFAGRVEVGEDTELV